MKRSITFILGSLFLLTSISSCERDQLVGPSSRRTKYFLSAIHQPSQLYILPTENSIYHRYVENNGAPRTGFEVWFSGKYFYPCREKDSISEVRNQTFRRLAEAWGDGHANMPVSIRSRNRESMASGVESIQ